MFRYPHWFEALALWIEATIVGGLLGVVIFMVYRNV